MNTGLQLSLEKLMAREVFVGPEDVSRAFFFFFLSVKDV